MAAMRRCLAALVSLSLAIPRSLRSLSIWSPGSPAPLIRSGEPWPQESLRAGMDSRIVTSAVALGLIGVAAVTQAQDSTRFELRIGTQANNPPYEFTDDDGTLRGFEIEIVNAVCAELRVRCKLVPHAFAEL